MAIPNPDPKARERITERTQKLENELRDRLIFLAKDFAPSDRGMYQYLEQRTGIPAARWKNVFLRRQMPTLAMLISIIEFRAPFSAWLLTGREFTEEERKLFGGSPSAQHWANFLEHEEWAEGRRSGIKKDK